MTNTALAVDKVSEQKENSADVCYEQEYHILATVLYLSQVLNASIIYSRLWVCFFSLFFI